MTGLVSWGHSNPHQPAQLPVAIDYPAALALRQMAAQHDEYPQVPAGSRSQRPSSLRAGSAP